MNKASIPDQTSALMSQTTLQELVDIQELSGGLTLAELQFLLESGEIDFTDPGLITSLVFIVRRMAEGASVTLEDVFAMTMGEVKEVFKSI